MDMRLYFCLNDYADDGSFYSSLLDKVMKEAQEDFERKFKGMDMPKCEFRLTEG